jgi:hypothetical protein
MKRLPSASWSKVWRFVAPQHRLRHCVDIKIVAVAEQHAFLDHEPDLYLELVLGPGVVAVEKRDKPAGGGCDTRIPGPRGAAVGLPDQLQMGKFALQRLDDGRRGVDRTVVDDNMLLWLQRLRGNGSNIALDDAMSEQCFLAEASSDLMSVRQWRPMAGSDQTCTA